MMRSLLFLCWTVSLALGGPVVSEEAVCDLCLDVFKDAEFALSDRQIFAQLVTGAERVCEAVSPDMREECNSVMNGMSQEVLHGLLRDMEPVDLCAAMTACPVRPFIWTEDVAKNVQPLNAGTEDACEVCEALVSAIDSLLKNKTSPQTANATAYKLCEAFPPQLRETCITFAPLIVDMLINGVDPVGACTNIGICMTEAITAVQNKPAAIEEKVELPADGIYCQLCELLVQTVDQYLEENKTEAAINATVYKLCDALPDSVKGMCLSVAPLVVTTLSKGVDPKEACTFLKLCSSTDNQNWPTKTKPLSAKPFCAICELLVKTVDQYLKENKTEAAINATVYKLCSVLPEPVKDACLSVAPKIVTTLSNGVDPEKACEFIQLCDPTGSVKQPPKTELPADGIYCQLCELLVQTVDQYLEENKTEAAINATVYKLCDALPDNIKGTCLSVAPMVVTTLSKGVDPKTACTFLKLCSSTGSVKLPPKPKRVADGPSCQLCEFLVQTVDHYLEENKTEAAINATIYKLCDALPDNIKGTCLSVAPLLVKTLSSGVDPKTACTFLKLCGSSGSVNLLPKPVNLPPKPKRVADGPYCQLCELLVQTVDQYLEENKTEAAINATVYKLCDALPDSVKGTCLSVAPLVVKTLSDGVDPKTACTFLKLCGSTGSERVSPKPKRVADGPYCQLCEFLVQTVDHYLEENKTEAAINATVYKLCDALPDNIKGTCLSVAPVVVSTLSKGVDPKTACTFLNLCSSIGIEISLPRITRKTDGPACEVCELIIQAADQYLKENSTYEAINATVYKICNELPDNFKGTCLSAAPLLVATLSNGVDPKEACTFVKLCDAAGLNRSQRKGEVNRVSDKPYCDVCEVIIEALDEYVKENSTEAYINSTVYQLCNALPGTLKDTCLSFAPDLVSTLVNGVDPKEACTTLKLCDSKLTASKLKKAHDVLRVSGIHINWCTFCKDHVGIIDQDLYREEPTVEAFLDGICHRLPPPTDQACLKAADTEFPQIWERFLNGTASADSLCNLLGACKN